MFRIRIAAAAVGGVLLFTSCSMLAGERGERAAFADHFVKYPGTITGVRYEDARIQIVDGHRYGMVRVRSMGLQQGGWDVLRRTLSDEITNAFQADSKLEAVFVVLNADGFPPNQAAGYHREQVLGAPETSPRR